MKKYLLIILLNLLLFMACSSSKFTDASIKTLNACQDNGFTWYNEQCWTYGDEGLAPEDVPAYVLRVQEQMARTKLTYQGKEHPLIFATSNISEEEYIAELITIWQIEDTPISMIFFTDIDSFNKNFLQGNATTFSMQGFLVPADVFNDEDDVAMIATTDATVSFKPQDFGFSIDGRWVFSDGSEDRTFHLEFIEQAISFGDTVLTIENDIAYLSGNLGVKAYIQISDLIENHPEVKTLIITNSSGSLDDSINMHTGRLIRDNGLSTKVLSDSNIASGAVDLFCSGNERIMERGAQIGVHSWCCVDDYTAGEIPQDHPAHRYQLDYFSTMLGDELGRGFYFYTLEAAPFDGIHNMSEEDIRRWNVATQIID